MSWVAQVPCESCGVVQVEPSDVRIARTGDESPTVSLLVCPQCRVMLVQPVDGLMICALLGTGAHWDTWKWPAELTERPDASVPSINEHDLATFVEALASLPEVLDPR
jgi:hypothetical protein